jgi:hypothetical protein
MAVQLNTDLNTESFIKEGNWRTKYGTFKQDAGRSGALVIHTLLAWDSANLKYVAFTDETATDGTQTPVAISQRALTEAQIKAGDVSDFPVYYFADAGTFDEDQLTIENSKTMDTVITVPANQKQTVRQHLEKLGMLGVTVTDIDAVEN